MLTSAAYVEVATLVTLNHQIIYCSTIWKWRYESFNLFYALIAGPIFEFNLFDRAAKEAITVVTVCGYWFLVSTHLGV